jgi:mannonate dehydratase
VTDVVARFPGETVEEVRDVREKIERFGLKMSVIEGYLPMELAVRGVAGKDEQIAQIQTLIRSMAAEGVPTLCYNFMHKLDWTRTTHDIKVRGGALVTGFDVSAMSSEPEPPVDAITEDQWWENLEYFLRQVLPVAEEAGVRLAMHPDDPPGLSTLHGYPRIMGRIENFERLVNLVPSPANGIAFCQGCFSEMGLDVPEAIRRLGPHIFYVHFRDVVGYSPNFHETFHDCGQTNMPEAMRAYRDIGFSGVMRPDHVPLLACESGNNTGYSMLGRLFAVGYMRGLIQAVQSE